MIRLLTKREQQAVIDVINDRCDELASRETTRKESEEYHTLSDAIQILMQQPTTADEFDLRKSEECAKKRATQRVNAARASAKLAKTVEVGDLIKVRGARDGKGFRLVLEVEKNDFVCRKMYKGELTGEFHADEYITRCGKEKLVKILTKGYTK